jgi:membrane protein EpsK
VSTTPLSLDSKVSNVRRGTFSVNVIAQLVNFVVSVGIGVFLTPYLIHSLGPEYYGLVPLAMTIVGYCAIMTVAINTSVSRSLTQAIALGHAAEANRIFNTSVVVCTIIAAFVAAVSIATTLNISQIISIPPEGEVQAKWLFGCTAISFIVSALTTPFSVAAFCRNRFDVTHGIGLTRNITRIVGIILLFWLWEPSIRSVGIAGLIAALVEGICVIWAARLLLPEIDLRFTDVDWDTFSNLTLTGWWVSVFQVGTILLLSIDLLVVNRVFGAESGGRYAVVLQWSALLRNFATSLAAVFSPTIIAIYGNRDIDALIGYAVRGMRFIGLVMAIPIGILCGLASDVLLVWLGPEYLDLAWLLIVLTAPLSINLAVLPLFSISIAANRIRVPGLVTIIFGVCNLALALYASTQTSLGIYGVAISGVVVLTLKNAIFTPAYAADNVSLPWTTFSRPLITVSIATAFIATVAWCSARAIVIDTWTELLTMASLVTAVYIVVLYLLILSTEERLFIASRMQSLASRFGFNFT